MLAVSWSESKELKNEQQDTKLKNKYFQGLKWHPYLPNYPPPPFLIVVVIDKDF